MLVVVEAHTAGRRELSQALLEWGAAARRDQDALGAHVYEDIEVAGTFCLVSSWADRAALEGHVAGRDFGIVLGALELLAGPPQVMVTGVTGEEAANALPMIRRIRDRRRRTGADAPAGVRRRASDR